MFKNKSKFILNHLILFSDLPLPLRVPNNNLHIYSKVLDRHNIGHKRDLPVCPLPIWEAPVFLNVTAAIPVQLPAHYDEPIVNTLENTAHVRRMLESQKGGVGSDEVDH